MPAVAVISEFYCASVVLHDWAQSVFRLIVKVQ